MDRYGVRAQEKDIRRISNGVFVKYKDVEELEKLAERLQKDNDRLKKLKTNTLLEKNEYLLGILAGTVDAETYNKIMRELSKIEANRK